MNTRPNLLDSFSWNAPIYLFPFLIYTKFFQLTILISYVHGMFYSLKKYNNNLKLNNIIKFFENLFT